MRNSWIIYVIVVLNVKLSVRCQNYASKVCPKDWEDNDQFCYKFQYEKFSPYAVAYSDCTRNGGFLLSINSAEEHNFVVENLNKHDTNLTKSNWWTSGRRTSDQSLEFFWEGDGNQIESFQFWLDSNVIEDKKDLKRIIYHYDYDVIDWGWTLSSDLENYPSICKVSKDYVAMINNDERDASYGISSIDPNDIIYGPIVKSQPIDIEIPIDQKSVIHMEFAVESNPPAKYIWYRTTTSDPVEIKFDDKGKYSFTNGKMMISIEDPGEDSSDQGSYYCYAYNDFGSILSDTAQLTFGYLNKFSIDKPTAVTVREYRYTAINCNAPSHSSAISYVWEKDDNIIQEDTEMKKHIFISFNGYLYFSEVTIDDLGEYSCVVQPDNPKLNEGQRSGKTQLIVQAGEAGYYDPDILSNFPMHFPERILVGDTVRLECFALGSSPLYYTWHRVDNKALPSKMKLQDHNRVLVIPNIQIYDGGWYECDVFRDEGEKIFKKIEIKVKARPYFIIPLRSQYADEGANITWHCLAAGIPSVQYSWIKNGKTLENTDLSANENIIVQNNVLQLKNVNKQDHNGMYQCKIKNENGEAYSSAELSVLAFAPSFKKKPIQAKQFASLKSNHTILCQPEAAPNPEIIWYKDNIKLQLDINVDSQMRLLPNGHIFINSAQKSDGGIYKCEAINEHGRAESSGELVILAELQQRIIDKSKTVEVNNSMLFPCEASHDRRLDVTYTWHKANMVIDFEKVIHSGENDYRIWRDPHYKMGTGHNLGGLYIDQAQFYHSGIYKCIVKNSRGEYSEKLLTLIVVGPPSMPPGVKFKGDSITATSAIIRWKPADINGAVITANSIETFNHWEKKWQKAASNIKASIDPTGSFFYQLTDLRPFSNYQVRVYAHNRYGVSDPSEISDIFLTDAVVPDLFPSRIYGGGGKEGTLVILWSPLKDWEKNGPDFGYILRYKPHGDGEFNDKAFREIRNDNGKLVIVLGGEDLYYQNYDIEIQTFNAIGRGPKSPIATIRSAMKPPDIQVSEVRAQPYNSTACIVRWKPVEDTRKNVKGKLGGYKMGYWPIEYGDQYENPPRVTIFGQHKQGMVIGLLPDKQYYFNVYVWNEAGTGPKSVGPLPQRTLRNAPLNMPTEIKVYKNSESSIDVYWRGVSTTNIEEPLEGYKVRLWTVGTNIKYARDYDAGKNDFYHLDKMNPKANYELRVFGYSRGGQGVMSSPTVVFQLNSKSSTVHYSNGLLLCLFIASLSMKNLMNSMM